ncbi:MAG: DUF2092 domain-containing protein [Candidatus Saelkia tenebricola]|nr:DUF2092 domain-containing protein [Candidatus Saelkia tenebricola]
MKKPAIFLLLFLFVWGSFLNAEDQEVEAVINDIQQKSESLVSYQADMEMVFLKTPKGIMKIEGYTKIVKPDKLVMVMGVKDNEETYQSMYSDGAVLWQYIAMFKMVSKINIADLRKEFPNADDLIKDQSNVKSAISEIKEGEVRYIGIETLDDEEVYVFEGEINSVVKDELAMTSDVASVKIWVSTEDGLQRRTEYYSKDGESVAYRKMKEVKINVEIPDSEFQFQIPEGVAIMDVTPRAKEMLQQNMSVNEE